MDSQTKVFRAHRALAWFYAAAGMAISAAVFFGTAGKADGGVDWPVILVIALIFCAHHFTARACREGKLWGRIASTVIACVMLLWFPIGTLIAIYLLSNTWRPWTPRTVA